MIQEDDRDSRESDYGDDDEDERRVRIQRSSEEKARRLNAQTNPPLFSSGPKRTCRLSESVDAPEEISADGSEFGIGGRRK